MINLSILQHLYAFLTHVGTMTNTLIEKENYKAIYFSHSHWPKRIFAVTETPAVFAEIITRSRQNQLPQRLTLASAPATPPHPAFERLLVQKNMALDLQQVAPVWVEQEGFIPVDTYETATYFAEVAAQAFRYAVDPQIVWQIVRDPEKVQGWIYLHNHVPVGCGLIYFENVLQSGLHMIGIVPAARGLGIGTKMSLKLMACARAKNNRFVVLQASPLGEPIYTPLGFVPYGEFATYQIKAEKIG